MVSAQDGLTQKSSNLFGALGLNAVPSARMDKKDTIRIHGAHLKPYTHGVLSYQPFDFLSFSLRQSVLNSSLREAPEDLFPGLDFKLRLLEEGPYYPAIVIGMQGLVGRDKLAGEYLVASKRYGDFDFTAGAGWGYYGQARHTNNPFISRDNVRNNNTDGENTANEWFAGKDIGFFGGVEWQTPLKGLNLKADITSARDDIDAPWSLGMSYQPTQYTQFGLGTQGGDNVYAQLTFKGNLADWPSNIGPKGPNIVAVADDYDPALHVNLHREHSLPSHIEPVFSQFQHKGRAGIVPHYLGLQGPVLYMINNDLQNHVNGNGSAAEIWDHAYYDTQTYPYPENVYHPRGMMTPTRLTLRQETSMTEVDKRLLYRAQLLASKEMRWSTNLHIGGQLGLNLTDNLESLETTRPQRNIDPVRSHVNGFTSPAISVPRLYLGYLKSIRTDLHYSVLNGYLEEKFFGQSGELLYRPLNSPIALGLKGFVGFRRDPDTTLAKDTFGPTALSAHASIYYDVPAQDATIYTKIGRYLDHDYGATIGWKQYFDSGIKLDTYATWTDAADLGLISDSDTHFDYGLRLSMPLGGLNKYLRNTNAEFDFKPLGRDAGQMLDSPLPLYELTQPFTRTHASRNWHDIN